ncbi:unnamed protein product, partial [Nesidiocoris tenuis]
FRENITRSATVRTRDGQTRDRKIRITTDPGFTAYLPCIQYQYVKYTTSECRMTPLIIVMAAVRFFNYAEENVRLHIFLVRAEFLKILGYTAINSIALAHFFIRFENSTELNVMEREKMSIQTNC